MASKTKAPQKLRRNERERKRVHQVNQGFNCLRERVPLPNGTKQKLSKVETLREAAKYIQQLRAILNGSQSSFNPTSTSTSSRSPEDSQQVFYSHTPQISPFYPQTFAASPCSYYGSDSSYEEHKFVQYSQ